MYRLAARITRPAEMFRANRNEMAIGGNGTTSMINTSRTTIGPESWVALNAPGRCRTVSLAMDQRGDCDDQARRITLQAAHHQRAGEGDDQRDTAQFKNERDRGFADLRHGLQNAGHKADDQHGQQYRAGQLDKGDPSADADLGRRHVGTSLCSGSSAASAVTRIPYWSL